MGAPPQTVKLADAAGLLVTRDGATLRFAAGDCIVYNGVGDYGLVTKYVFHATYNAIGGMAGDADTPLLSFREFEKDQQLTGVS